MAAWMREVGGYGGGGGGGGREGNSTVQISAKFARISFSSLFFAQLNEVNLVVRRIQSVNLYQPCSVCYYIQIM